MMATIDIRAWMKDEVERAVEPLRRDIEDLKAENTKRDAAIEELKHELATLNIYLSTWGVMKVKTCKNLCSIPPPQT